MTLDNFRHTIEERAFRAYFRRFGKNADAPSQHLEQFTKKDKDYIRLSNVNGTLAVYRILNDNGLKFIKK